MSEYARHDNAISNLGKTDTGEESDINKQLLSNDYH